jgi:hypothetical protein
MDSQPGLFEELPQRANPRRHFAELSGKIIPFSIWKDLRIRADLSSFGAGCPVSRNEEKLVEKIMDELEFRLGVDIERDSESLNLVRQIRSALERKTDRASKPRINNKLAHTAEPFPNEGNQSPEFINPKLLIGTPGWEFGPSLKWLNDVDGISQAEKAVYGWMTFRADKDGVFRGSLRSIARDAGISWSHMSGNILPSLANGKGLLYREDHGRAIWFRFLKHPAMSGQLSWPPPDQPGLPEMADSFVQCGQQNGPHKEPKNKEEKKRTFSSNDW